MRFVPDDLIDSTAYGVGPLWLDPSCCNRNLDYSKEYLSIIENLLTRACAKLPGTSFSLNTKDTVAGWLILSKINGELPSLSAQYEAVITLEYEIMRTLTEIKSPGIGMMGEALNSRISMREVYKL
jgi:hypothetical protein